MSVCYALVLDDRTPNKAGGWRCDVLGVFMDADKAVAAMNAYPNLGEEDELQIEEWPLNELTSRLNTTVIASR